MNQKVFKNFHFKSLRKRDFFSGIVFDVPKPSVDVHEDVIALIQSRCKRLLADMKQKMFVIKNLFL
jgi:hypothetical protein